MSIHPGHLREYVIRPTLKFIGHYSESAEELLMLTAAAESECGRYLHQVGGPALGVFQMEPTTHDDIWANWLEYKALRDTVSLLGTKGRELPGNLYYATAMARCHYLRVSEALPNPIDTEAVARYWKRYYNTSKGAGTVAEAVEKYHAHTDSDTQ